MIASFKNSFSLDGILNHPSHAPAGATGERPASQKRT
jgi:hypothetical protein